MRKYRDLLSRKTEKNKDGKISGPLRRTNQPETLRKHCGNIIVWQAHWTGWIFHRLDGSFSG